MRLLLHDLYCDLLLIFLYRSFVLCSAVPTHSVSALTPRPAYRRIRATLFARASVRALSSLLTFLDLDSLSFVPGKSIIVAIL